MFKIIPEPCEININGSNTVFSLKNGALLVNEPSFSGEFKSFVKENFDVELNKRDGCENRIVFELSEEIGSDEGYCIICKLDEIIIKAEKACGFYYALQTLKQIFLQTDGMLPEFVINDSPRYPYRAFLLDSGRYYQSVDEIKKFIDLMSFHKMNYFHWHLTEDQGWRIEIKKYPELTKKGQRRSHTNFGFKSEEGFYTQEQIKDIVNYCHERFIKVIPEFDVPGHTVSAIACYPYLSCFDRKLKVATHWGVKHDVLCAGKESTYDFVFSVIDELVELFSDKYIHIGGDEVVKMRWERCEHCQSLMKNQGLKNENELQQYFMNRVNSYVKSKGYTSIMWNYDKIDGDIILDNDIIWQSCSVKENTELLNEQCREGRSYINSEAFPYYLDFPNSWNTLKSCYEYNPDTAEKAPWGVEAALWTEYIPNMKSLERHTFPRIAAICENAWCDGKNKSYEEFYEKMPEYLKYLDCYGVQYTSLTNSNPSKLKGSFESLWFNRRVLHWQGLHNLADDLRVNIKHKKL